MPDPTSPSDRAAFLAQTGFDLQQRGAEWAPLRDSVRSLILGNLQNVPWIPPAVITALLAVPAAQNGGIVVAVPVPTTQADGRPTPGLPSWLSTADRRMWWDDFAARVRTASMAFNDGQIARGRLLMAQASGDIAFWNRAIAIAKVFALPVTLVEEGAAQFLSSSTFKLLLALGIGYGIWQVVQARRTRPARKALA